MPPGGNLGKVNGFQLLKFLGKGTFGAVYQAKREEDGKIYAIKKVDTRRMGAKDRAEAVNEIRVLASIVGPHVITFHEAFVEADILYIVTEFATHGDLFGFLNNAKRRGQLAESTIWTLFIQMCLGVQTLHEKNILHRDLKGANVFMCANNFVKLGDLGVSKVLKHQDALARTQVGTPYYVAPEIWRNRPYNSKCDIWSLGCMLYELCTFRPPFEAQSMEGLARNIMKGKFSPIPPGYSKDLQAVVARMLVVDPERRSSIEEILALPAVQSRLGSLPSPPTDAEMAAPMDVDLCRTIVVPRKFNDLTKNLPAARYETPLATPQVGQGAAPAMGPRVPQKAGQADILKPVAESGESGGGWAPAPVQHSRIPQPAPRTAQQQPHPSQQQQQQQQHRVQEYRSAYRQQASGVPPPQRQRVPGVQPSVAPGVRLPAVPGAAPRRPPSSQSGGSEIRVHYHNPRGPPPYNRADSKGSIYRSNPSNAGYNPVTHQDSKYSLAGGNYPPRYAPQQHQSRLSHLHSGAQAAYVAPPGNRRRAPPVRYY